MEFRPIIEEESLDESVESFSKVLPDAYHVRALAAITRAVGQFNAGNFGTAVVLAWFVVEAELNVRWSTYLDGLQELYADNTKRISSKRRDALTGKDWTASARSQVLEMAQRYLS
jgi:hypothetical protein